MSQPPRPVRRLCVQWPRFGPYHLARLRATHTFLHAQGAELVGLETAAQDATYAWRVEAGTTPFRREQVFQDRVFETVPPAEMHAAVTATLDRLDPDAVAIHTYSFPDSRACLAWCRRHRRTAILMTDTKADDAVRVGWREHLKARIIGQYDAALLAGTASKAYFEHLGFPGDLIFLGYDVVDNAFFRRHADAARANPAAHRDLPGLDDDTPFFLASNRFIERKNLEGLLAAYHRYRAASPAPWRLILLGDGPLRSRLEDRIQTDEIEGVVLPGFLQIDQIPIYYGRAGAFVHPAFKDQWALVVNEAMAAGLPVIVSTGTGCVHDLVQDGVNGYRFDAADTDALARLLQRLADPATDRAAMRQASEAIIAAWTPDRFAHSLWAAAQAGAHRAGRPFEAGARSLLWLLRQATRSANTFHSVEA